MTECDGYFEGYGIPYEEQYQDAAVYTVRTDPDLDLNEKKRKILCWFDVTYGSWNGNRYDLNNSREKMSKFLQGTNYKTFEELLQWQNATQDMQ